MAVLMLGVHQGRPMPLPRVLWRRFHARLVEPLRPLSAAGFLMDALPTQLAAPAPGPN